MVIARINGRTRRRGTSSLIHDNGEDLRINQFVLLTTYC